MPDHPLESGHVGSPGLVRSFKGYQKDAGPIPIGVMRVQRLIPVVAELVG